MRIAFNVTTIFAILTSVAGCATKPPTQSGFLDDYSTLQPASGNVREQVIQRRNEAVAAPVNRVVIARPVLAPGLVLDPSINEAEIGAVQFELERQLCFELSRRFVIGAAGDADAGVIETAISGLERTSPSASVASAVASRLIPGPGSVRLPVGRGGLIVEGRARAANGDEAAAMVWSRGAGVAFDRGSLSEIGDAHRYAEAFAADFTAWLAGDARPASAVSDPDPCAAYGPRIDLVRAATSIGTGLHQVGEAPPTRPTE